MSNKIEFDFIENRFEYELPLIGVDMAFIEERREEINLCFIELKKIIIKINISTGEGNLDLQKAAKLSMYYRRAHAKLNKKANVLLGNNTVDLSENSELAIKYSSRMD